jgi:hypothetical protein
VILKILIRNLRAIRVDDINNGDLLEGYMGVLKVEIKHDILLRNPTNIMESMHFFHCIQANNKSTHKSTIGAYIGIKYPFGVHKTRVPQPTRFPPQQMDERRSKGICFDCDNEYNKGHKCGENKLLYIDYEEE